MPTYCFRCRGCGHRLEAYRSTRESGRPGPACPRCRRRATARDLAAELPRVNGQVDDMKPFFSDSMGCLHAAERIEGETYDRQNRVLVRGRRHRAALMKKLSKSSGREWVDRRDWREKGPARRGGRR